MPCCALLRTLSFLLHFNTLKMIQRLSLILLIIPAIQAFAPVSSVAFGRQTVAIASEADDVMEEPRMNPNNPNLPELKGDFDWDAKFSGDDDWITENVPGKMVLNEVELAAQVTELTRLEESWRKERAFQEFEEGQTVGWVGNAEILNSRFAMFFLVTGLLTELWTGVSIPGQVEEMLRIGGFIGFD